MPDIASVVPVAPATQTLAAATATANTGPGETDFAGQLEAALKSPAKTGDLKSSAHTADAESDDLPEALAALGLVLVPAALQPPTAESTPPAVSDVSSAQPRLATAPVLSDDKPSPTPHAQPAPDDAQAGSQPPAPVADQPPLRLATPAPDVSSAGGVIQPRPPLQHSPGFQGSDAAEDDHEHRSARAEAIGDASVTTPSPAVGDPEFAATLNAAAPKAPAAGPAPSSVHPTEVVSQIAHQADLYRLPGNRGVRIQLYPDDLGSVQITVRYAASGGLELHIDVEHAATGALVQAGWTELRDALATQGISPDRLVMSITASNNASQPDFSSNGGASYRAESGAGGFMQRGQSGQQREDGADERRVTRGWNDAIGPLSTSDEHPRGAAPAAASRIDYRV